MMPYSIASLVELTCDDSDQFGGKAANLGELASMGLSIPSGIALGRDVLAQFLESHGIDLASVERIHSLGMTFIESALQEASETQKRIIEVLDTGEFAVEFMGQLHSRLDVDRGASFAVRSSCVVEDARLASFAGQYVSVLDVAGDDALLRAIRQCWASQYTGRALSYALSRRGMPVLSPGMAVVIQHMLKPTFAGVCFSTGPTPRTKDNVVVESVSGCGEALVSGSKTPSHYELSRGGEVLKKMIPQTPQAALPPDSLIVEVAAKTIQIAEHFGCPQDVEWAAVDGTIYFLQARPITAFGGRREPAAVVLSRQSGDSPAKPRVLKAVTPPGPAGPLRELLHEWLLSDSDIAAFRAVCYLLLNQRVDGSWRVEGKPEWNEVATAMTVHLFVNGGYPASLKWNGPTDASSDKEFGLPLALRWLASRAKPDGTWGSDLWDTCQVLRAFCRCGVSTDDVVMKPGLAYVINEIERHLSRARRQEWFGPGVLAVATDLFAELAMPERQSRCVDLLLASQKPDGEFYGPSLAPTGTQVPSEWHTAQAVTALARHVVPSRPEVRDRLDKACTWLCQQQKLDGSWGVTYEPYCSYNVFFTSYAVIALMDAGSPFQDAAQRAYKWLRGRQLADGSFGDIASSLMAVSALQRRQESVLAVRIPIPYFLRIQYVLGSNDR